MFCSRVNSFCKTQANHKELEDLLPRQGFRMDGRHYSAPPEAARHANVVQYNDFVRGVQGSISVKLVEIFKANAHTNVNLKAAVNAMLVLNKIKLVSKHYQTSQTATGQLLPPSRSVCQVHAGFPDEGLSVACSARMHIHPSNAAIA